MLTASRVLDRVLVLEMVRVTESRGRSPPPNGLAGVTMTLPTPAVEAMRQALNELTMDGTVVIGEGERDEAPMLYIGEKVGWSNGDGPSTETIVMRASTGTVHRVTTEYRKPL